MAVAFICKPIIYDSFAQSYDYKLAKEKMLHTI